MTVGQAIQQLKEIALDHGADYPFGREVSDHQFREFGSIYVHEDLNSDGTLCKMTVVAD